MSLRAFLTLLLPLLLCTCGPASDNSVTADTTPPPPPPTAAVDRGETPYPNIPFERLQYIYDNATYLDATFYDLPISINQKEQSQIRSTLSGVGNEAMNYAPTCKAIGHIWFQINGENVEEADIYFQDPCAGYVWYDDGKPAYSSALTEQGANFYLSIFQSVKDNAAQ